MNIEQYDLLLMGVKKWLALAFFCRASARLNFVLIL